MIRFPRLRQRRRRLPADFDAAARALWAAVEPFTMTSPERVLALCEALRYVSRAGIAGAVVECGVWRGGSMMAAARTLLELGDIRPLYLFDTFSGMPPPGAHDHDRDGVPAARLLAEADPHTGAVWARSPLDEVRRNLLGTGYPADRISFVPGRVEETLPAAAPESLALLRLDTDWYASTRHELEHLFPRLVPGGVLIIDDYGHWDGARRAVDEYLAHSGTRLLLARIDDTGRIAVKSAA